ncbi:MAG: thiamine phosphate synthase [Caulobacterales bacterium]|nr:thiamine phosphate synthase [Caulobacterales bacterium]
MAKAPTTPPRPPCRLYLITPPEVADLERFAADLEAALDAGDVAALQIRLKPASDEAIRATTRRLMPIAQARGVAVILNDRPDLARELGCDGVHVGQDDASLAEARRTMGPDAMIGVTCHDSYHLAMEAAEAGADYVAFGAFFPTATKATTHRAAPELLVAWQAAMEIPCVAIGGVTAENARGLAEAGADFVAVSGAVWGHPQGPSAGVRAILAALES